MSKCHVFLSALLGFGLLAMNALTAEARGGGGGGGGGRGGGGHAGGNWGGGHVTSVHGPSFANVHHQGFVIAHGTSFANVHHPGFAVAHGTNFANVHRGRFDGRGREFGSFPWSYGYYGLWYGGYPYGAPLYYDSYYSGPPYVYRGPSDVGPPYNNAGPVSTVPPAATANKTAEVEVSLPVADAQVWVDGKRMPSTPSTQRSFVTPPLQPGQSHVYHVTATWMENGQEMRVERTVPVTPGGTSTVNFSSVNITQRTPASDE